MSKKQEMPDIHAPLAKVQSSALAARNITPEQWDVLRTAIFPAAETPEAIMLAIDYCRARNLDPFKRPVHIVPIWSKRHNRMVESVWPGISEIRTTAMRTSGYAGRAPTSWGPDIDAFGMTVPEWAEVSVYRVVAGQRCEFAGPRVYWMEAYARATAKSDEPNSMWKKRPRGQLEKCAEAAALRQAFPEELGGDIAAEELNPFGDAVDAAVVASGRNAAIKAAIAPPVEREPAPAVADGEPETAPAPVAKIASATLNDDDIPE